MTNEDSSFELESDDSFHVGEVTSIPASLKASVVKPEPPEDDFPPDIESDESGEGTVQLEVGEKDSEKLEGRETAVPSRLDTRGNTGKRRAVSLMKIPILTKETTNPNTFDLDFLLSSENQKRARDRLEGFTSRTPDRYQRAEVTNPSTSGVDSQHVDHLLSYKHVYEAKKKSREAAVDAIQMRECTFRPHINSPSHRPRSPDEYAQDMNHFQSRRQEKLALLQQQSAAKNSPDNYPYQPSISSVSRKMAVSQSQQTVFTRLSDVKIKEIVRPLPSRELTLESLDSQPEIPKFTPEINQKSRKLQRNGDIGERLMEDAKRRAAVSTSPSPAERPASPALAPNSSDLLKNRFLSDLTTLIGDNVSVSYSRFKEILISLRLLDTSIRSTTLCAKLWTDLASVRTELETGLLRKALLEIMALEKGKQGKLHKDYYEMYCWRMRRNPQTRKTSPVQTKSPMRSTEKSTEYIDNLIASKEKIQKKVAQLRNDFEEKELGKCSFKPQINKNVPKSSRSPTRPPSSLSTFSEYREITAAHQSRTQALHTFASVQREKRSLSPNLPHEDTTECTFAPVLRERKNPTFVKQAKGVEKAVQRMIQAREELEWKGVLKEKGRTQSEAVEKERQQWSRRSPKPCS